MIPKENNFAYIDGNNLYRGVKNSDWKIDFLRFRKWLTDKYGVVTAYYFIGLIPKEKDMYEALQKAGFTLMFKEVVYDGDGKAKGNCDADLVLQVAIDTYENKFDKAVIVSSDGDYASLIKFLQERSKLKTILSPSSPKRCSILLKRIGAPITYLDGIKKKLFLNKKEKAPAKDKP